jgi:hypothetical protein
MAIPYRARDLSRKDGRLILLGTNRLKDNVAMQQCAHGLIEPVSTTFSIFNSSRYKACKA